MPRGANKQREREYGELKREFKKEGRYRGREKEVAARIVNKQRSQFGETRSARAKDRAETSPDKDLPIKNYDGLTVPQVKRRLDDLDPREVRRIESYERKHKNRSTLLDALDRAS
jgi:hypothetical protein